MKAKDFVKSKFPKAKAERHWTNRREVYFLIRDGRNTMYMAEGSTESKAWANAKVVVERTIKNVKQRKGFINRHIDGLPKKIVTIKVVTEDYDGEHIDTCEWKPFDPKNYVGIQMPGEGYLGTATVIEGQYPGIGFHAWEQNNSEFVYYAIV